MGGQTAPVLLKRCEFAGLGGWLADDHAAALGAFRRSVPAIEQQLSRVERSSHFAGVWEDWQPACIAAEGASDARRFFEQHFTPCHVVDEVRPQGLFTGYYEPLAQASLTPSEEFQVPIYGKPHDLISFEEATAKQLGLSYGRVSEGQPAPYFTRSDIEQGALGGRGLELLWLKSWVDAFFIQVQGSGRVRLETGRELRLAYAAKSGLPYTSIGTVLIARGILSKDNMSMQALRGWMAQHPHEARELMWHNQSFVFFKLLEVEDPNIGAPGAQYVGLTPLRSLAIDRSVWVFGTPVWLSLMAPSGPNASLQPFNRLMIAQDTGSAIKGAARGDVYWGWGEAAASTAGHMASPGSMTVLLPNSLAARSEFLS